MKKHQLINLISHISFIIQFFIFGNLYLLTLIIGWIWSNLFHYLFMHRIVCHGHFRLSKSLELIGLVGFSGTNLGSPIVYPGVHINHHKNNGLENDPHDPERLGICNVLLSNWDDKFTPLTSKFKQFYKKKTFRWFHQHEFKLGLLYAVFLPFLPLVSHYMSKIVIAVVHFGEKNNGDNSKNLWWLKPLTWGEELHYNHHLRPGTANHNLSGKIFEIDILYYIGKMLSRY